MKPFAVAITCLLAASAAAAAPEDAPTGDAVVAARTPRPISLDGRLDEEEWAAAPAYSRFVESFPSPGLPASFRTEVRVLYDDAMLYVGVVCFDPQPRAIVRQLARRDTDTTADRVEVAIDSGGGGRTAYVFTVNAAGVLRDQLVYADVNTTDSWDAVWDAAVAGDARGWSVELAIPLRQLRFSSAPEQQWGFVVRRHVPRTHQVFGSVLMPREANPLNPGNLVVSRFGRLEGLSALDPPRGLELLPYVAARATVRPQYSDPARPRPRLVDPLVDVGLDLKSPLGSGLTLTGAINPDFGQVESDEVIQNLQNSEPFFPEKRPFFMEGLDVFEPVGSEYGVQQQLFYSRRIGLDAPILGAVKVTGSARRGLEMGVLDSVVMGAGNAALVPLGYGNPDPAALAPVEQDPDRSWRFRLRQPFRFGPENALPSAHPVSTNYFAAVGRQRLGGGATAGAMFTAATPLEPRCRRHEFATDADYRAAGCDSRGSNALGLDLTVPGEWGGFAQVEVSQAVGGPDGGRTLRDGTVLRAGDLGFGGHMRWGKLGGEPWRFEVQYLYEDAKLDLNDVGYQPLSDFQWVDLVGRYVRPNGFGPFHSFKADTTLDVNWDADGKMARSLNWWTSSKLQLPGYQELQVRLNVEHPQWDTREIARSGIAFERTGHWYVTASLASDPHRELQGKLDVVYFRTMDEGPFGPASGWSSSLTGSWRPHPRLETKLEAGYEHKPQGPRWLETLPDGTAVFGVQDPRFVSVTLRQQLVFTPRLSAQLYAQAFSSAIRWGDTFYGASVNGRRRLSWADLAPVAYAGDPASHDATVNLNAVIRWEYRLGSTLYAVYTRSQSELPARDGDVPSGLGSPDLFRGRAVDTFLVKWSWWRGG
ncbi:conserved hypothetical protein [Anaeromyxobacter sp. K]|uniref:carbohydrate binding family 9 domain-containing protein n=1 Tax=Anaeromyxobacter sp. (strain K) TaxID=447217 RepID=UPI00015F8BCC|nr:carbohydrate binding family 9 domain-containing protein [Anaeromyxobacter sp. K]ACG72285.1 conserved hypothetical protein [Anaeromyxobacter sp. K]